MAMKKTKMAGDNISLKTKKNEDPLVMAWLNAQTNLMDSLRYLMENEIMQNGVRNLQMFIPMERAGALRQEPLIHQQVAAAIEADDGHPVEVASAVVHVVHEQEEELPQEEIDDEDIEAWS
ncbi:hypothetical protein [Paenibacillus glycanilyticus]|nr:hypothetical protein [Paenibacillus glycanilyticus]